MKFFRFSIYISLIAIFSSCGLMYRVLLGVDPKPEWESSEEVLKQADKYNIPTANNLILDTVKYRALVDDFYRPQLTNLRIKDNDSTEYFKIKRIRKDDFQPVQFRLFKKDGKEIFKMVNCYVDPPIPMNWNVDGCFDTFPAKTEIESLNTHNFDLDLFLKTSTQMDGTTLTMNEIPEADYYGVILWNNFFKKPSKKLIKTVHKYVDKSGEDVHIFYIYNQYAYLWPYLNAEQKHEVIEANNKLRNEEVSE